MSGICGIFSTYEKNDCIDLIQYGLYALQHRGQEGFGVVTMDSERLYELKRRGLLSEVLTQEIVNDMKGYIGLGMVKYAFGHNTKYEPVMPFVYDGKNGNGFVAIDGTIINDDFSISELIGKINSTEKELRDYISSLNGPFCIVYICKEKMVVIRDKNGIKPICIGQLGDFTICSSESCALDAMGANFIKDIGAGEIYIKTANDEKSLYTDNIDPKLCLFEMIYIARPDSIIDGDSVYKSRFEMGRKLVEECPTNADIVIGSPDSGLISAKGYARESNIDFVDGILKNRYIQRTFIKPSQEERTQGVNIKLNAIKQNIEGKDVVLVDDSIVRGTTIKRIIKILRDAGARKIHVRVASPQVVRSERYTIDIPDESNLIAFGKTVEEVREKIGCDSLYYLSLEGLKECCGNKGYYDNYFIEEISN